jgi:hypothetical protein
VSRNAWITLSALVVVIGIAIGVLVTALGREETATTTDEPPVETSGFDLPLLDDPSSLALGGHDKNLLVGIAARPGRPVEIAALRAETPVPTDELEVAVGGRPLRAEPCGRGCSRVSLPVLSGSTTQLTVRNGTEAVRLDLPATMPPDGDAVFDQALQRMDSLRSYRFTERLSSGRASVVSRVEIQAPDRLRLRLPGFGSVIIGRNRWDLRNGRWEKNSYPGLDVRNILMWHEAKNARVLDLSRDGTRTVAAYGLQPVPSWFRLEVEPSGLVREAEMTAASHFMLHRYRDFDEPVKIEPPTR